MSLAARVDDWVITRIFEPCAWYVEYRWEVDYALLARAVYGLGWFVVATWQFVLKGDLQTILSLALFGFFFDQTLGRDSEHKCRVPRGTPNLRRGMWRGRLLANAMFIALLASLPSSSDVDIVSRVLMEVVFAVHMWFEACNPMPPGYREAREVESAERHLRTATMRT